MKFTKQYEVLQGDCLELMKEIPDKSVSLILSDLPYGLTNHKDDVRIPFGPLWEQFKRVRKDNAATLLFGQGLFFADLVNSNRKEYKYDIVWDKGLSTGFLNAKRMPLRRHEQIAVFYGKQPVYHPQFHEGKPLHGRGTAYLTADMVNRNYGSFKATEDVRKGSTQKYPTSIVSFQKPHPSIAKHRTEKPVALLEYLIRTYTDERDVVLDCCMGAGSTGIACMKSNRRFIGIELDKTYFDIGKERISEAWKENVWDVQ